MHSRGFGSVQPAQPFSFKSTIRLSIRRPPFVSPETGGSEAMKYAVLIYSNETIWEEMTDADRSEMLGRYNALTQDLKKRGQYILGEPLDATSTSSTVRARDGKTMVTDGPFAETKEQLGGFYVVDVPDLDAALAIAARVPSVHVGSIRGAADPRVWRITRTRLRTPGRTAPTPAST